MLTLNVIANILFLVIGSASFSNFFDDCLEEGEIFDMYGRWVKKEVRYNHSKELEVDKIPEPKWKRPIGGCIVCTNTWITIIFTICFAVGFYFFKMLFAKILLAVIMLLMIIGISNTALKFIVK